MAKAPPPEPIDHHYDIAKLTTVFAIVSILVLPVFAWMTWQDYGRDWKDWQKKFVENDRKKTREALRAAAEKIDPDAEQKYLDQKRDGARELRRRRAAFAEAQERDRKAEGAWYEADQDFRFKKAEMDTARYVFETRREADPRSSATAKAKVEYERLEAAYGASQVTEQAAKQAWDEAKAGLAALEKTKRDAEEALAKLDEDYDRYQTKLRALRQDDAFYFVRNAPIADMLAPSLKIQQVQLGGLSNDVNFLRSERVDRCMTCHIAADKRGFEDKQKYPESVLRTHPRLDLFVDSNSPHPYATFGCTSCHGGRDRATDFTRAGHMPNDYALYEKFGEELHEGRDEKGMPVDEDALREEMGETQTGRWMRQYDWELDRFNDLPMYPMKAVEAGCFRCHRQDAGHPKAPKLDEGRKLVEALGCWTCHKMKGLEDLPRPGPNLARLASKTTPEWTERWLVNPRAFRSNTKMPRFFYLENFDTPAGHRLTDTMIAGVTAYLFEKSGRDAYAAPAKGDAARGKQLAESVGCRGCHITEPGAARHVMDGWRQHGPNLIGLSEKVTPGWLAAWLKNPKAYNPETRMPNLRLSDDEIADLVAYLMSRPSQPEFKGSRAPKPDALERDAIVFDYLTLTRSVVDARADIASMSAKDKDLFVGEKIIGHYGCYACHNIPGFEKAKPIGVELSEWGNKPVHLLDFAFVHLPHTRADWLAQKVGQPRSFDREKVKTFQEKLKMPQFSLSPAEIEAVQAAVLGMQRDDMSDALQARAVGARGAVEAGRRIVKDYNCQGCHVLEDRGGAIREAMAADKVDLALAPPIIRGEGAKVQSEWLFAFLHGPRTGQIRPWLKVRMPTFGFSTDQINVLTGYFATQDKARYPFEERIASLDPRSREAGAATFASLKCAQCHPTSQDAFAKALKEGKTPADLAPILAAAHTRLRYDWIADWIRRPEEWMPGTRMPTNFPKLDDKSDKRISPLAPALDTPAFAALKRELVGIWGSEAEAKAYISDPDRVTKALRDHVWSLGNDFLTVPRTPRKSAATVVASH
ncbi:MAG: c-type cytochrome [Thermoanaerobaculia bacterium]